MIPDRPVEPGKKKALAFTLTVHLALVAALFFGVQWKRSQPEVMEVELWAARPSQPAPPPPPEPVVEPPPEPPKPQPRPEPPKPEPKVEAPKKPDVVIKEEKKKPEPVKPKPEPKPEAKPEPKKPEPKPEPKKPEPKKVDPEPRPDPFKEMLERETRQRKSAETQARLNALADAEQRAAAGQRGLADYATKIRGKIRGNIVLPPGIQANPEAIFEVNQLPTGEVLSVRLKRSSGLPALDAAIERAIRKSSPLPKPDDPSMFQRTLEIKYKPFEE